MKTIRISLLMGISLLLGACHVPPPVYVIQGPPEKVTTNGPPPDAKVEAPSVAPSAGYVWLPGYWHYGAVGAEYLWVEGRWAPERQDYYWHEATYVYVNSIWVYRPPFWRPRVWQDPDLYYFQQGRYHQDWRYRHRHRQHQRHGKGPGTSTTGAPSTTPPVKTGSATGQAVAPPARGASSNESRLAAPPATVTPKTPPPKFTSTPPEADSPGEQHTMAVDPHVEANLRRRPEYKGDVEGRLSYGDDADGSKEPGYVTDHTGAIILTNEPRRVRRSRSQEEAQRRRDLAEAARRRPVDPDNPNVRGRGRRLEPVPAVVRGEVDPDMVRGRRPEPRRRGEVRVITPEPRDHRPPQRIQDRPDPGPIHRTEPRIQHRPQPRPTHRAEPRVHRPPQPRIQHRPEPRPIHRAEPRIHHRPEPTVMHRPEPRRKQAAPQPPDKRRERAAPAPAPRREGRKGRGRR